MPLVLEGKSWPKARSSLIRYFANHDRSEAVVIADLLMSAEAEGRLSEDHALAILGSFQALAKEGASRVFRWQRQKLNKGT